MGVRHLIQRALHVAGAPRWRGEPDRRPQSSARRLAFALGVPLVAAVSVWLVWPQLISARQTNVFVAATGKSGYTIHPSGAFIWFGVAVTNGTSRTISLNLDLAHRDFVKLGKMPFSMRDPVELRPGAAAVGIVGYSPAGDLDIILGMSYDTKPTLAEHWIRAKLAAAGVRMPFLESPPREVALARVITRGRSDRPLSYNDEEFSQTEHKPLRILLIHPESLDVIADFESRFEPSSGRLPRLLLTPTSSLPSMWTRLDGSSTAIKARQ